MASTPTARYARGAQRRTALIESAADLMLEDGIAALSHRAVAARAELPLASTTYYFASADDLRDEALRHIAATWADRAAHLVAALPDELSTAQACAAIAGIIGAEAHPTQALLMYERYLEAGRHEALRPVVTAWNARLTELVRQVLERAALPADHQSARLALALADGVAITSLAEGEDLRSTVTAALALLLTMLRTDAGAAPAPTGPPG